MNSVVEKSVISAPSNLLVKLNSSNIPRVKYTSITKHSQAWVRLEPSINPGMNISRGNSLMANIGHGYAPLLSAAVAKNQISVAINSR